MPKSDVSVITVDHSLLAASVVGVREQFDPSAKVFDWLAEMFDSPAEAFDPPFEESVRVRSVAVSLSKAVTNEAVETDT